jgi:putative membrane protein
LVAKSVAHGRWAMPLRGVARLLGMPTVAFVLMNGTFVLWHVPSLYNAALVYPVLHDLEHATFFFTALLLWMHLLGDGPWRS